MKSNTKKMFLNAAASVASVGAALHGYGAVEDHGKVLEANSLAAISSDPQAVERHEADANSARNDRNNHIALIGPNLGAVGLVFLEKEKMARTSESTDANRPLSKL